MNVLFLQQSSMSSRCGFPKYRSRGTDFKLLQQLEGFLISRCLSHRTPELAEIEASHQPASFWVIGTKR